MRDRVAAEQPGAARRWPDQAEQHPQRGGLAGAVRAQVAVDVAGLDGQVDAVDRGQVAVALHRPRASTGGRGSRLASAERARRRLGRRRRHAIRQACSGRRRGRTGSPCRARSPARGREAPLIETPAARPQRRRRRVRRPPARARRSRPGRGRRAPSRPAVPVVDQAHACAAARRATPARDSRNGSAAATAAVPVTDGVGPPTRRAPAPAAACTWTIFVARRERTVRSEDGTAPK